MAIDKTLYDRVGGRQTLDVVHKIFYDKVYAHPWMKLYFADQPQEHLERQQTSFMGQLFGGPRDYWGKAPKVAHQHMVITEELFQLRSDLLRSSLEEAGVAADLIEEWMQVDATFKAGLLKKSAADCQLSYATQTILDFPPPYSHRRR